MLSPISCNSALIFDQSKFDVNGSYATTLPSIVNNSVPPKGASSWLVFILPIVRLLRARTEVSLCTMPGLSAPLNLNFPAKPTFGQTSTLLGSTASKHDVLIPPTSAFNSSPRLSASANGISTSIMSEKCPPSRREWDSPTFPPLAVTILVTSATMPGRSAPIALTMTHFLPVVADVSCLDDAHAISDSLAPMGVLRRDVVTITRRLKDGSNAMILAVLCKEY
mmetsp:Transcript_56133/g.119357  ORF Transcript_56133/g.119357 Transcript_56133/m.119357 type:complete len:223 (+) Transcript_56133:256-924(+)